MNVTVVAVEQEDDGLRIAAVCERDGERQHISLSDLPLPSPPLEGGEWIAAYRLTQEGRNFPGVDRSLRWAIGLQANVNRARIPA